MTEDKYKKEKSDLHAQARTHTHTRTHTQRIFEYNLALLNIKLKIHTQHNFLNCKLVPRSI